MGQMFTNEGETVDQQPDCCSICGDAAAVTVCCGEDKAESKDWFTDQFTFLP